MLCLMSFHATDLGMRHATAVTPTSTPTLKYSSLPSSPIYHLTIITSASTGKREGRDSQLSSAFVCPHIFSLFFLPIPLLPPFPHFGLLPSTELFMHHHLEQECTIGLEKKLTLLFFFVPFPRVIPVLVSTHLSSSLPFFRRHFSPTHPNNSFTFLSFFSVSYPLKNHSHLLLFFCLCVEMTGLLHGFF